MRAIINILPARKCLDCERWTTTALLTSEWTPNLNPVCPWHGYFEPSSHPTQEEVDLERASLIRFVVAIHSDMGTARIVKRVEPESVPGYSPVILVDEDDREIPESRRLPDSAWYVRYSRPNKMHKMGWVVYIAELFTLTWMPERRTSNSENEVIEHQQEQAS